MMKFTILFLFALAAISFLCAAFNYAIGKLNPVGLGLVFVAVAFFLLNW